MIPIKNVSKMFAQLVKHLQVDATLFDKCAVELDMLGAEDMAQQAQIRANEIFSAIETLNKFANLKGNLLTNG